MAIDPLPPLREIIAKYDLRAKRSLGQNFLLDLNLTSRIARIPGDLSQSDVLEIGPGPGGLTRGLLASGARRVVVIEKDERCLNALREISSVYPRRLEIIAEDALRVDPRSYLTPPIRIVANLPYNIGTELFTRWLDPSDHSQNWPPFWQSLTLMFQREVADRIIAKPGEKAYGRLSVLTGWRNHARIALHLPPQAFSPPPKISSAVVHIQPRATPLAEAEPKWMRRITEAAFQQRRKMLRASLKPVFLSPETALLEAGIDPTLRAERLPIEGFATLARLFAANQAGLPPG